MSMPGEAEIVRIFRRRLGVRGAPDDVEALPAGAACWCVDTLSAGTDVPPGMGLRRAARKSVVSCASDLAAKGFAPASGLASVSLPAGSTIADASALAGGLAGAAAELGFAFAGGDTGEGAELSITVCLAGAAQPGAGAARRWPGRGGARPGDAVFATGEFGLTAAGLRVIAGGARASGRFARAAASAVYSPRCRARFGAAAARMFTSSMDTSDGLSAALEGMARGSGAALSIGSVPLAAGVGRFAAENGLDARRLALWGGEEYEIAFTARPSDAGRIAGAGRATGTPVSRIGTVEEAGAGGRRAGTARLEGGGGGGGGPLEIRGGWRHLGGSGE